MKKSDLKNRMVVECRNGEKYMVIGDRLLTTNGHNDLIDYDEELRVKKEKEGPRFAEFDIMKVYNQVFSLDFNKIKLNLLWQRSEVKEVTMAEIEEKFGCKVKIVSDE